MGKFKLEVDIGGTLTDVSSIVRSVSTTRGQPDILGRPQPGRARFLLVDQDRDYDPTNTTGPNYGDLLAGTEVVFSVDPEYGANAGTYRTRWRGEVAKWDPQHWNDEGAGFTLLECVGLAGSTNQAACDRVQDMYRDRFSGAQGSFYCSMHTSINNGPVAGFVRDFSGRNSHGLYYPDEIPASNPPGAWNEPTAGAANFDATKAKQSSIVVPLPRDTSRSSGFLFAAAVQVKAHGAPSGALDKWALFSDRGEMTTAAFDGHQLDLIEVRTGSATASTNKVYLAYTHTPTGTGELYSMEVGTRGDWIDKWRYVAVGHDGKQLWFGAAVIDDDGDLGGQKSVFRAHNLVTAGNDAGTQEPEMASGVSKVFRVGRDGLTDAPAVDQHGLEGHLSHAAVITGAGFPPSWGATLIATQQMMGFVEGPVDDRIDQVLADCGFAAADFDNDVTSGALLNEVAPVGGVQIFRLLAEMVGNEHGRIFQDTAGKLRLQDWAAAQTQAATSQATYSDQVGTDTLIYRAGQSRIDTGTELIVNRITVRLGDGYTYLTEDAASVAAHGVRARSWDLIHADPNRAADWADLMLSRFSTETHQIRKITFNPDYIRPSDSPSGTPPWWEDFDVRDIGDRVTVKRQPGGVGAVFSHDAVIIGEEITVDEQAQWNITYHLAHIDHFAGDFDFNLETDVPWHSLWWASGTAMTAEGYANGGSVTDWPNETSEGDLAADATAPVFRTADADVNSKASVEFTATGGMSATLSAAPSYPVSIVSVAKADSLSANRTLHDGTNVANEARLTLNSLSEYAIDSGSANADGTADTDLHLHVVTFGSGSGSNDSLLVDRVDVFSQVDAGSEEMGTAFRVGANTGSAQGWEGPVGLVGIFEGDIQASKYWDRIRAYMADFYGLDV